ncbi:MAG: hypothetical protein R3B48_02835 [Kofleriaceae bacterium]
MPAAARRELGALLGFGALALVAACGDDVAPMPDAPMSAFGFLSPAELPRTECVAGSLRAPDPVTVFHGHASGDGTRLEFSARLDVRGRVAAGLVGTREAQVAVATADDLFLRAETTDALRVLHFCARDSAGDLIGTFVSCSSRGCLQARAVGRPVRRLVEADAHGLTLLGETTGGGTWGRGISVNVRVRDGLAYVARYGDGLRIVDVTDPAAMRPLGHVGVEFPDREIYNDVKVVDGPAGRRYALMASNVSGAVVIDVTDPAAPVLVGHFGGDIDGGPSNVHTLAVDGGRAYLANTSSGLVIYDITDPRAPTPLGRFSHPSGRGYLHDLHVVGDLATLNWWDAGMAIVDVSAPATPRLVGTFEDYGQVTSHSSWILQLGSRKIALHGDEQYGARLHVVDVTEGSPTFARSLGSWGTRDEVSIHNVMALGDLAIIAYYQDGVRVVDVSNPAAPALVAWFNTWRGPETDGGSFFDAVVGVDVDAATRTVYVADIRRGLLALRLESQD